MALLRVRATVPAAAMVAALVAAPAVSAAPNNNNSAKLRQAVTLSGVRAHQQAFQNIATMAGGNRFAGLPGHDRSAQYVIRELRDAGYEPTVHRFTYDAFFEVTPSELERISPAPQTFVNGVDFHVMQFSGSGTVTSTLVRPTGDIRGCTASDWAGAPVAGRIAIVQRGTPPGAPTCTFRIKADSAKAAGAAAVLVYNNVAGALNGTMGAPLYDRPVLGLPQALGETLLAQMAAGPVTMRVRTDTDSRPLDTYNVLAETDGGDPDNVVMVGAHLDSVAAGPGINDNGSGSAAILETAIQMEKVKPRNKVRFAWWSAEESGLVGSTRWVADQSAAALDRIALYLNFDMVGSPNFVRFVYDGDNSAGGGAVGPPGSDVIEQVFVGYFDSQGLASDPTPFNGRSDYGPFIAPGVDIPAGGLFTGAEQPKTAAQAAVYGGTAGLAYDPCYHATCDTFANNSNTALDQMSDAIAHATITFGQNTELVNGIKGKGNFKRPPLGTNDPSAGGGGGLHDDHTEG
jgi:Zn-dependent M28 family amino/carboxypeptidase